MEHNEEFDFQQNRASLEQQLKKAQMRNNVLVAFVFAVVTLGVFLQSWGAEANLSYIEGNELRIARTGSASTGNIWKNDSFVSQLTWSSLFTTDASFNEVNPGLADTITVSPDGLTYTIVLKENLKWSDGAPLTIEDLIFSMESYVLNSGTNNTVGTAMDKIVGVAQWKEVGVSNWAERGTASLEGLSGSGNTLTVTLENPHTSFPLAMTQFVPLPKHCFTDIDPSTITSGLEFFIEPVSSGMYMVDCVNGAGDLELIQNPYYYDSYSDIARVVMYGDYKTMFIDHYATTNITEMVSYRSMPGFVEHNVNVEFYRYFVINQMADYKLPEMVPMVDESGVEVLDEEGNVILVESTEVYEYSEDRAENELMQSLLIRQGLNHALDRETLLKEAYLNSGKLSSGGASSEGSPEFVYEYNPEKAKALFQEAGYDFSRPFTIGYYHTDSNTMAFLEKVQGYLEDIGLTVRVVLAKGNENLYERREYDMFLKALSAFNTEDWFNEYLSTNENMHNVMGTTDFDDLLLELQSTTDEDSYAEVLAQLNALDIATCYKVPLFTLNDTVYTNGNRLHIPEDMEFGNTRYRSDLRLDEWYIKKG